LIKKKTLEVVKIDSKGRDGKMGVASRKKSKVVIEDKDSKVVVEREKLFRQPVSKSIID